MKIKRLNEMPLWYRSQQKSGSIEPHSVQYERAVDTIIIRLKEMKVDGDSMQNILEEVGMDDQMLKQLVRTQPKDAIQQLLFLYEDLDSDKNEIEKFLLHKLQEPRWNKILSDLLIKLDTNKYNI